MKTLKSIIFIFIFTASLSLSSCSRTTEENYQEMIINYQAKGFTVTEFYETELMKITLEINNKFLESSEDLTNISITAAFIAVKSDVSSFVILFQHYLVPAESKILIELYSLDTAENLYFAAGINGRFFISCNSEEAYQIYKGNQW